MSLDMKALVLHAVGDARYETVAQPALPADWVLVRIGFCGVCGSDLPRMFSKGTYHFPTVCGHEFAGIIAECGAEVTDFSPGDKVAVFPLLWCGRCIPCERGQYVQCENYDYLGSRRDGGFAEYVAAPGRNLVRVSEGVSLEEAAMTEPAAVALHTLRRAGGCSVGDVVAVFGAGPIGLMVAQWARIMGAACVAVFDILPEKLTLARKMGFENAFDSRKQDPVATLAALTCGEGAHLCVEAAGVPQTTVQALAAARRGGRVVLMGNPSADVTLPASLISQVMRRELSIFGTWNSEYSACGGDDDWRAVLAAMASKALDVTPLITHIVPLEQAWPTLQQMQAREGFFSKVLIQPESQS